MFIMTMALAAYAHACTLNVHMHASLSPSKHIVVQKVISLF